MGETEDELGEHGQPHAFGAAREVRARVERSLRTRAAPSGTFAARTEEALKVRAAKVWAAMKRRPSIGVVAATALGLGLASTVGVGELAIALVLGYAAYQVLAEGVPVEEAARRATLEIGGFVE
jgi:hypothetical protein